jgi:FtsP/CotA-like multicopper oxidase with cupredoxin domain
MKLLNRRKFLQIAGITVGGIGGGVLLRSQFSEPLVTQTGLPFHEPPLLKVRRSQPGLAEAQIIAARTITPLAGLMVQALAYNGTVPGATLRFREGEHIRLTFTNHLDVPTNLHQIPRPVETPTFMYGGKGQANLFAVKINLKCIGVTIFFVNVFTGFVTNSLN